ncbi:MAG TPA: hypothetical protein VD965_13030 [Burkholderiales bacterium]|nr:hypothetical protein [Burkholderiales bacterium]
MNATTRVGTYEIEVRQSNYPTLWHFSSGERGRKEAGIYAFWTAVLKPRAPRPKVSGRALVTLPPGDRFDRIRREARAIWLELLERGRAIRYIRPATEREVQRWLASHAGDARFARRIRVPR